MCREVGRSAALPRGLVAPGDRHEFDFLGFTHIAGTDRRATFQRKRRTSRKKRNAKLAKLRADMHRRRHEPVPAQHTWLTGVLEGHYNDYGVPTNSRALRSFRERVRQSWHDQLQRRSQRARGNVTQHAAFAKRFPLPLPTIQRPWPGLRDVRPSTRGGSPVREIRSPRSVPTGTVASAVDPPGAFVDTP